MGGAWGGGALDTSLPGGQDSRHRTGISFEKLFGVRAAEQGKSRRAAGDAVSGPEYVLEGHCVSSWLVPTIFKPCGVIIPTSNLKKTQIFLLFPMLVHSSTSHSSDP